MSEEQSEPRSEGSPREVADEMEQGGDEMEKKLGEFDEQIDDAKKAADNRPEAGSDAIADVAGDWEDEAAGADQGDDATDAPKDDDEKRDADD